MGKDSIYELIYFLKQKTAPKNGAVFYIILKFQIMLKLLLLCLQLLLK
ncbi:hypothetical protein SAMN05421593_0509 [Chryseobacterium culicis]|uniref:Uncharacterized protein n=1 Tax=Chryseobacterium culicis TaxID=680127 RepID=A0A1H6H0W6_CHRCI|nr:hypothetical protein SAMN05421593_0509 [Chryseobacterium culicis]